MINYRFLSPLKVCVIIQFRPVTEKISVPMLDVSGQNFLRTRKLGASIR